MDGYEFEKRMDFEYYFPNYNFGKILIKIKNLRKNEKQTEDG